MIKVLLIILIPILLFCIWCCLRMASIADKEMIEDFERIKKSKK